MDKLFYSLVLILGGLSGGYFLQQAVTQGGLTLPLEISRLRVLLQKIGLLFFMPISFLGAVWVVSFSDARVAFLPIIGLTVLLSGGVLGMIAAKLMRLRNSQVGVMYCCGSFTNIGAIGGLVCYLFLGEVGFALVALYKMFEEMSYYLIGFPLARYYGTGEAQEGGVLMRIWKVLSDPFVATILSAFFIGLGLNLGGFSRPPFFEKVTMISVPIGTFLLIFSIGLGMRFSKVRHHSGKCVAISLIKFVAMPVIGCSFALLAGLHHIGDGTPFKVVMILSSMPVAFNALVAASLYELDLDLANSLWLTTTLLLVAVLPLQYFFLNFFS
jgi:predicted permease